MMDEIALTSVGDQEQAAIPNGSSRAAAMAQIRRRLRAGEKKCNAPKGKAPDFSEAHLSRFDKSDYSLLATFEASSTVRLL